MKEVEISEALILCTPPEVTFNLPQGCVTLSDIAADADVINVLNGTGEKTTITFNLTPTPSLISALPLFHLTRPNY